MPRVWEALERAWRRRVLAARLYSIDLFRQLSADARLAIAEAFETVDFAPGAILAEQGRALECLYVVREGQAELALPAGREVVALRAGDYVGELALLEDFPQAATVTAPWGLRAVKLTRAALASVLDRFEGASASLRAAARQRTDSSF
jgi:CRP-like cAMP-binding protein